MTESNPYQAPESDIRSQTSLSEDEHAKMEKLARGQKLVIYAVLAYFLAVAAQYVFGPLVVLLLLGCLVMSLVGVIQVLSVLDSHLAVKILLFILLFLPLINMLVLLRVNSRATKTLREAGYTVGFMGASK